MNPLELINDICSICSKISALIDTIKANKEQCKRLAYRLERIADSLKKLERVEDTEAFRKALSDLRDHILECEKCIIEFTSKTGLARVFKSGKYKKEFERLNCYLEQDLAHLHTGIDVQQLMNREDDEADRRKDAAELMEKQDEILKLVQEETDRLDDVHQMQMDLFAFLREELQHLRKPAAPGEAAPSQILIAAEDIEYGEKIAEGEATIYRGRFRGQDVAIKKFDQILDDSAREQFKREVQILGWMRSDHVVFFYGACLQPNKECLVMKYMAHGSLNEVLEQKKSFIPEQQKRLAVEIAKALHYLHSQGMIHRDLRDRHILFDEDWHAKLTGFGLAKVKSSAFQTAKKEHELSVWSAPELFGRSACHTPKTDVYAYGLILWELVTGQKPEEYHENIPETAPKVYADIIRECLDKDPSKRPGLEVVIRDLEAYVPRPKSPQAEELYELGQTNEKAQKFSEAMVYYQRAADKGYPRANTNLGHFFYKGLGVPVDKNRAFALTLEAAQAGHARAQFNVGQMFEYGEGTAQDYEQALFWYQKAALQEQDAVSSRKAKERIPRLLEKMTEVHEAPKP